MMRRLRANGLCNWLARVLRAGAIAAACPLVFAATQANADPTTILVVRFGGDSTATRVVIESDRPLTTRIVPPSGDQRHVVLSLPGASASTSDGEDDSAVGGLGLVKLWRLQSYPGGARLVLDLCHSGRITHRFVLPPSAAGKTYRYVVDVAATDVPAAGTEQATVEAAPRNRPAGTVERKSQRRVSASPALASAAPVGTGKGAPTRRTRKVIVVDAGHGGHDPGAQAAALDEKDITLATALALRKRLERGGRYKVVMTRDSDVFIPLPVRVQIARRAGADLFISLHADSAGSDPDTHGASVYTLSDHGETRVSEVLGQSEWFSRHGDRAGDPAVGRILLDLTQRSTLNRSALFASLLVDRVSDKIDLLPNTRRDAGYFVLLAPDVPAVLLEMGFITSPRDQTRLTDVAERNRLTDAIAGAIDAYFDAQPDVAPPPGKAKTVVQAHSIKPPLPLPPTQSG
jgi:N-acetylmuramoyl-L-alanine amidase